MTGGRGRGDRPIAGIDPVTAPLSEGQAGPPVRMPLIRSEQWAREFGIAALSHIGMACAFQDRRIAHEYHEKRAVTFARRAAHHAFIAYPELRHDDD